jgi:predicted PolB exonuclease-like 3'-5' exonuclease
MNQQPDIENILFLDIETVPLVYRYADLNAAGKELWDKKWQYKQDVSPEQQYQKSGIYAEFAKVVCIGLGYYHQGKFRITTLAADDESTILQQFSDLLAQHFNADKHFLCAHNGKEFDFPFLCRRFLIHNMALPRLLQLQGKKPWEVKHLDTMDMWKFGDVKNFSSLNLLAYVFGIPSPKDELDGSMVGKTYYEEHNLKKIETYCMKDVITLARVYNRFAGLGNLADEDIIFV